MGTFYLITDKDVLFERLLLLDILHVADYFDILSIMRALVLLGFISEIEKR